MAWTTLPWASFLRCALRSNGLNTLPWTTDVCLLHLQLATGKSSKVCLLLVLCSAVTVILPGVEVNMMQVFVFDRPCSWYVRNWYARNEERNERFKIRDGSKLS